MDVRRGPIAGLSDPANIAVTGGTLKGVQGVQYDIAKWDIPIVQLSTGSMGNNGAVTGLTATLQFPNAYVVLPAGAIAAGVPAAEDVYFAQFSSPTACTVFNNRLADNLNSVGAPTIPASPTAFATTGPGAFTGVTTSRTLITIAIPAGAMGVSGEALIESDTEWSTAATNKTLTVAFGGTNLWTYTHTTTVQPEYNLARVKNRGSASVQRSAWTSCTGAATLQNANVAAAINTGNAVNVTFVTQKVTATENLIFHGARVSVVPTGN